MIFFGSVYYEILLMTKKTSDCQSLFYILHVSFTDDTTVYLSHKNLNELYNIVNQELVKPNDWFCANKLALNIKKLNIQYLEHKINVIKLPNELTLSINNFKLTRICNHQA
jgi:hypothetical protein